jgi:hypothetical protein
LLHRIYLDIRPAAGLQEGKEMVFNRKQVTDEDVRRDKQSVLVQRLVDADEVERRQILLVALQTGDVKKSEAADLMKLVERLAAFSGRSG